MQCNAVQATTTLLFTSTKNREIFHYQQGQNKQQHAPDIHQNITQLKRLATKAILIHFKTLFTQITQIMDTKSVVFVDKK